MLQKILWTIEFWQIYYVKLLHICVFTKHKILVVQLAEGLFKMSFPSQNKINQLLLHNTANSKRATSHQQILINEW